MNGGGPTTVAPEEEDCRVKFAAAKAFPSVVGILSRDVPVRMAEFRRRGVLIGRRTKRDLVEGSEIVFWGSGIILECSHDDDDDGNDDDDGSNWFIGTIICPATLFVRSNHLQPHDIHVDVYLWDGVICRGRVVACDFHYNLAAIQIQTRYPLQTATLRYLDDAIPVNIAPFGKRQRVLVPHSTKFNISPGTPLITIARAYVPLNAHIVGSGVSSAVSMETKCRVEMNFNELYWIKDSNHPDTRGGVTINYVGEVIGLMFYANSFLPMNLISTWWNRFKSCRQYHRPYLGVEIASLHLSCSDDLRKFVAVFPNVTGGVLVTKVDEDSPAYCSGIRPKDVIVKCDGKVVYSSLELFEILWNKVGEEFVELDVLSETNGETRKLSMKIQQTSPEKMYQWKRTFWNVFPAACHRNPSLTQVLTG